MLEKWLNWLLGKKASTTVVGVLAGAAAGAAGVAMNGNTDKHQLIAGAVAGAVSAVAGVAGRGHGEG